MHNDMGKSRTVSSETGYDCIYKERDRNFVKMRVYTDMCVYTDIHVKEI